MYRRNFVTALAAMGASGVARAYDPARMLFAQAAAPLRTPDVIFVPTPDIVVEKMLEMAAVTLHLLSSALLCRADDDEMPPHTELFTRGLPPTDNRSSPAPATWQPLFSGWLTLSEQRWSTAR